VTQNRMQHLLNKSRQRYIHLTCWNLLMKLNKSLILLKTVS
jgi:hypothetical protein